MGAATKGLGGKAPDGCDGACSCSSWKAGTDGEDGAAGSGGSAGESGNTGQAQGAGIFHGAASNSLKLKATILAKNDYVASAGSSEKDIYSTAGFASVGYNLYQVVPGTFTPGPGDVSGQDPQLGNLIDNSGPTATRAPGPASPAVDKVPPENGSCTDANGAPVAVTTAASPGRKRGQVARLAATSARSRRRPPIVAMRS